MLYVTYTVPWNPRYGGAMRCHGILRGLVEVCDPHVALAADNPGGVRAFMEVPTDIPGIERSVQLPDERWSRTPDSAPARRLGALLGSCKYRRSLLELVREWSPLILWFFEAESYRLTGCPRGAVALLNHVDRAGERSGGRRNRRRARTESQETSGPPRFAGGTRIEIPEAWAKELPVA
ncbi:MAG: hypothetical protein ACYCYF_05120 [Anaerolineae bacterium]